METVDAMETDAAAARRGLRLAFGAAACLAAAGGLLWWREGGDVFSKMVTSFVAWCF